MRRKMTRIAFLLIVHGAPEQVNLFIKQLLGYSESYIYIHVDAKATDIIPKLLKDPRVFIAPRHIDIRWGDYTQIMVNNYMLRFAKGMRSHDYYSLHSGADLCIRPIAELVEYLNRTYKYAYCLCSPLPNGWQYGGGVGRLALTWPKCFRARLERYSPMRYFRSIYGKLYGAGLIPGKKLPKQYLYYGGADWFTIREDCVVDLLHFIEKEEAFESLFFSSLSGAEIYYVSIFNMTSKGKEVENANMLRYVDWRARGQKLPIGSPNTCTMDFVNDIEDSGAFFARKFNMLIDSVVIGYFLAKTNTL